MLSSSLVQESKQPAVPVVFPARLQPACMGAHGTANAVEALLSSLSSPPQWKPCWQLSFHRLWVETSRTKEKKIKTGGGKLGMLMIGQINIFVAIFLPF